MKTFLVPLALFFFAVHAQAQVPVLNSYPSAKATLFLDFDGHLVDGTNWNFTGPIFCGPSNLNASQITEVFNRVAEDYRPFNINVTTDSTVYEAAPVDRRIRVVLTITSDWYGVAGGVAYTNSFTWGNNTPCFVFTALHQYNVKNIAEAASHEAGHTLGLRHQALYDSTCKKVSDYNSGTGSGIVGWAPIMGVGYYRNNTTWHFGPNPYGCTSEQDDLAIITRDANGVGYRQDDDTATLFTSATRLNADTSLLAGSGLISTNTDTDLFQFAMPANGLFHLNVNPYSIAANDEGSNLDVQVQLYNPDHILLNTYNPADKLSASIDTTLTAGTYYVSISGASTPFAASYASLGAYTINGSVPDAGPVFVRALELRGTQSTANQQFNWIVKADAPIAKQVLERSDDGFTFVPVATFMPDVTSYTTTASKAAHYRLHVYFGYGRQQYSNSINLRYTDVAKPQLYTNVIHSNTLQVSSPDVYKYAITNVNGQLMQQGAIKAGANNINMDFSKSGLYLITFQKDGQLTTQKFVRE